MNKDIQKLIDDSNDKSYSKLSDKRLAQFEDFVKKGGRAKSDKKNKHLKILNKKRSHLQGKHNVESGHLASIQSKGGKAGAKSQMEKGLGIHTDKETRREWARLGGLKTIAHLNRERTCPHCKIVTKGAAYNRWHGDNCKHKK